MWIPQGSSTSSSAACRESSEAVGLKPPPGDIPKTCKLLSRDNDEIEPCVVCCSRASNEPHFLEPGKTKDHHRSGCRGTRRNGSAVHAPAHPVTADESSRNHGGDGRSVAPRRSSSYFAHARTHRSSRYSRRSWSRVPSREASAGNRAMGTAVWFRGMARGMDASLLSSARPVGRDAGR